MQIPNRKQRRAWAKASGSLKKKRQMTLSKQLEISRRAREVGKEISTLHRENILRNQEKSKEDKQNAEIQEMVNSGLTIEESMEIFSNKNDSRIEDGDLDSNG